MDGETDDNDDDKLTCVIWNVKVNETESQRADEKQNSQDYNHALTAYKTTIERRRTGLHYIT